jgi:hypothetical protein
MMSSSPRVVGKTAGVFPRAASEENKKMLVRYYQQAQRNQNQAVLAGGAGTNSTIWEIIKREII